MDNICNVSGCLKPKKGAGFCNAHHLRYWRHGDPLGGRVTPETVHRYFTKMTERRGDCLIWKGSIKSGGYGSLKISGVEVATHRYAYEQVFGNIPSGLDIDHLCHVRECCNVRHLRAVTRKQNLENRKGASKNNKSGHLNVSWLSAKNRWNVKLTSFGEVFYGGTYPPYEIHVAAYYAKILRNNHFTHNNLDRD